VGVGVNRFYCCGKLASITLIYGAPDNNNKKAGEKENCCRNEKQSFKIKDTHVTPASFALNPLVPIILPSFTYRIPVVLIKEQPLNIAYQGNAPPGNPEIPAYTLNCTYRI
jgi:hypothetical protein